MDNAIISSEEKWKAVVNCENQFDGLFYYGVKTTGIFCKPSCTAKTPLKKNTVFLDSPVQAINAGFRPCKMCRPDISEHMYEPNKILLQNMKEIIDHNYNKGYNLKIIAQGLGMSESNITRLFKQYYGLTPNEYVVQIRVEKAKSLLSETNVDIFTVAYEVGFKSLSNFYKCFKEQVGCTPKSYRKGIL